MNNLGQCKFSSALEIARYPRSLIHGSRFAGCYEPRGSLRASCTILALFQRSINVRPPYLDICSGARIKGRGQARDVRCIAVLATVRANQLRLFVSTAESMQLHCLPVQNAPQAIRCLASPRLAMVFETGCLTGESHNFHYFLLYNSQFSL